MILNSDVKCNDEGFITQKYGKLWVGLPTLSYSWSANASGPLNYDGALAGVQNAAVLMAGCSGNSRNNVGYEYNGNVWNATSGNLSCSYCLRAGTGAQNAAVLAGGRFSSTEYTCTEEYNGVNFTLVNGLPAARFWSTMSGTQNAGLIFGGCGNAGCTDSLEYNGTNWSTGGSIGALHYGAGGAGSQNATTMFGGLNNATQCVTWEYNGTNWSLNQATPVALGGGGCCQNAAFGTSRNPNDSAIPKTYLYNGSSWSLIAYHSSYRLRAAFAGNSSAGLAHGGTGTGMIASLISTTSELSPTPSGAVIAFKDDQLSYYTPPPSS